MPYFDRFDICEAHLALESDYNVDGVLQERPSNKRRKMSTGFQLFRMDFEVGLGWRGFDSLSENGKEIYRELETRYGFNESDEEVETEWAGPQEDDLITEDHSHFMLNGKVVLTVDKDASTHEMWHALEDYMTRSNYWPNVWFISDHGNAILMKRDARYLDPRDPRS
jgi:hypothetical protein